MLLAAAVFGVVIYNFLGADPEGDGGGTRFAILVLLVLIIYCLARVGQRVGMRREAQGFPVAPSRPPGEA